MVVVPVVSVKRANLMETLSIMLRVVGGDCGEHGSRVKNSGDFIVTFSGGKLFHSPEIRAREQSQTLSSKILREVKRKGRK